jgi:hypothetical protein
MSFTPWAFRVAAVVDTTESATMFENPMSTRVSS